ncbi:MAG TPA: Asp-tRNA(Asn)/Glu-tRNA(Gln) amidotransferase subunit GatA [Thermoanaerobaculia bacterium]|nr:Asp-tRNA(Asn)/Glu-tRNA(Gln) amidotransferase subunit GatA [Thermoanaerobaculia bacterium]
MTGDLARLLDGPAHGLAAAVSAREVRARDVAGAALLRAGRSRERHGAFLHVAGEDAIEAAAEVDRRVAAGEALPLAGVPIAVKDNVHVAGMPTTAGSRILGAFVPPEDATCVARLKAAGCVVVGKTSCDELGMGSTNETSAFGPVRNPWEPTRVPGGSSGGSAAAVAARAVPLAVGTDTGGSVRLPAAFCGLVGVRPTFGRVSRLGLVAFASSFDQAGPLARHARDAALALEAMSGADPRDATSLPGASPDLLSRLDDGVAGLRVGLLDDEEGVHPDAAAALSATARLLASRGASLVPLRLPRLALGVAAYYLIAAAEASSNLARFDGVRFGARAAGDGPAELVRATRAAGFGDEVKRRVLLGTFALSAGHREAWYERAQRVRTRIALDLGEAFRACDLLLSPTAPGPAFPIGEKSGDPLSLYLTDVFTVPASLAGLPAVAVPAGLSRERLPVGVQLAGPAGSEALLLAVARELEAARGPWTAPPDVIR